MNNMNDPLELMTDIKPAMLDYLADEGYARHRDIDLARAAAESLAHRSSALRRRQLPTGLGRPRRLALTGGVAVTAAAAAAAAVLAGAPSVSRPQTAGAVPGGPQSARGFLLASAVVAARAPATTGTYWYVRERDFEPTIARTKTRKLFLPGITYAETQESWTGQNRSRTIVDERLGFNFASAADKARWMAAGKPPLPAAGRAGSTQPETSNYHIGFGKNLGVGNAHLTLAEFRRLPVTAPALDKLLRLMWNGIPDTGGTSSVPDKAGTVGLPHPTFADYVFEWADALLTGPAAPGTKAAVYQLLAQQPGITIAQAVTDPIGRTGVAVADGQGNGGRDYMVIDPRTAQLLAYTTYPVRPDSTISTAKGGVEVYQAMGWTSQMGIPARP